MLFRLELFLLTRLFMMFRRANNLVIRVQWNTLDQCFHLSNDCFAFCFFQCTLTTILCVILAESPGFQVFLRDDRDLWWRLPGANANPVQFHAAVTCALCKFICKLRKQVSNHVARLKVWWRFHFLRLFR